MRIVMLTAYPRSYIQLPDKERLGLTQSPSHLILYHTPVYLTTTSLYLMSHPQFISLPPYYTSHHNPFYLTTRLSQAKVYLTSLPPYHTSYPRLHHRTTTSLCLRPHPQFTSLPPHYNTPYNTPLVYRTTTALYRIPHPSLSHLTKHPTTHQFTSHHYTSYPSLPHHTTISIYFIPPPHLLHLNTTTLYHTSQ